MSQNPTDTARVAGRGVLWIAAAKAWFMVAGYAIEFVLPHLLTLALFGVWKVVVGVVSVLNNTIVTATIQTVSKFSSERDADAGIARAALRMQLAVGGALALGYFLLAPLIAGFERDATLTPYLRSTAAIVFCYALYAVFVGIANGLRRFHVQAGLDMTFSTLKATLVITAAALGLGVGGAIGAFVTVALMIVVVAFVVVKAQPAANPPPMRRMFAFLSQLVLYTLLLNLLLLSDLFLLKRLAAEGSGLTGAAAAEYASRIAGTYAAAQTLARIPYQGILAVAFVVFPLISRATFAQDRMATQAYVRATMRFVLLASAALASVFAANPAAVLRLVYPAEYQAGASALVLLAPAQVCFSLFAIACTILNAAGATRQALGLVGATLLLLVALCMGASSLMPSIQVGVAAGVLGANALGVTGAAWVLHLQFAAMMPAGSLLRTALAMTTAVALGHAIPDGGKLQTLVECVLCLAGFVGTLFALREFGPADRAHLQQIFARARGA